jgi:hypothetical protein
VDGREYIDIFTINPFRGETEYKALMVDRALSTWAAENPVQRIAAVEIHEIEG